MKKNMRFGTKVIHAGIKADEATGAVMTPIYQTSTYKQKSPGEHKGFAYSRASNPTRKVLETNLAALENGKYGLCFGSGMAAVDAVLKMLNPGDEVIACHDLYGGSYRLFKNIFEKYGIQFTFIPMQNMDALESSIGEQTKMVWIESPTNPMLNIIDIEATSIIANQHNALLVVDNTFATPYLQNPLDLGADIVMHSVTKYIGGHSDVLMGALVVKDNSIAKDLYAIQNSSGAVSGPQDCFLALRGVKTLHLRMQRHCENAMQIAKYLDSHDQVEAVYYPGLETHPSHQIAKSQMKDFGGMLSFSLKGGKKEDAFQLMSSFNVFSLAESLGGVESLICHPASMTHAAVPKEEREKAGISDALIRLSIGIEDIQDLLDDLELALKKV